MDYEDDFYFFKLDWMVYGLVCSTTKKKKKRLKVMKKDDSPCLWNHEKVSSAYGRCVHNIISQHIFLFIGKEWTNMAAPRDHIWGKKYFCCININSAIIWNTQMDIVMIFSLFPGQLVSLLGVPFILRQYCRNHQHYIFQQKFEWTEEKSES